ncbi:hypothetical protein SASPL_129279 [Salvia splendens]|uniref:Uncharacterized protein n=1 Tax=Salvia splendens TaxID=180675 RepID=A0A8X8XCH1_SALSN|nr:hypothetical protein SASPL_129279 [Salvia splendens]
MGSETIGKILLHISSGGSVVSGVRDGDDANHASMDVHYMGMIEADPMNSMLFTNYATFLKEVRGDILKGEPKLWKCFVIICSSSNLASSL